MDNIKKRFLRIAKSPSYADHKWNFSRRELIKLGLLAGVGAVVPLSLTERVLAQAGAMAPRMPFLTFDFAGGASMPGNFLVGRAGGPEDLCESYANHGWNPRAGNALDSRFGLPMSRLTSKMLEGMLRTLPAEIAGNEKQTHLKFASMCNFSLDDTNDNRLSALTLVSKAGLRGKFEAGGIGQMASRSGGNSDSFLEDDVYKPKAVTSAEQLVSLSSFGWEYERQSTSSRRRLVEQLAARAGGRADLRKIYESLEGAGTARPEMHPNINPAISRIYQLDQGNNPLQAAIVYNVVAGLTGPGAITIDGCDYHDNTQATGDNKDLEIGLAIGRAVSVAFALKKPLFLHLISDGGVTARASNNFERVWAADQNQHSLSVVGYFDPNGKASVRKQQLGQYVANATVDQTVPMGGGSEKMVQATLVSYLALQGLQGRTEELGLRMDAAEIDALTVFGA